MITAVVAGSANAQMPLSPDDQVAEQATTAVAQVAEPVPGAVEQVAAAVAPVSRAAEQVAGAVEPVSQATEQVTAEPLSRAAGELAGAAEPVSRAAGQLAGAAQPVLDATAGVAGSVAAPAVRLGASAAPVGDVVDDLTRPVGGALTGDRSLRPDRAGEWEAGATFGRPGSGRPPSGPADGAGSKPAPAGGLPAAAGPQGPAPDTSLAGATIGPSPAAPDATRGTLAGAAPGQPLTTAPSGQRTGAPALATGYLSGLLWLPDLAGVIAAPSPETSTSTSRTDHPSGQISPERQPTPAPSAPAGAAAAGAAGAGSAGPLLALLALLLLAAPSLSLLLRTVPEFLRPAPFIVALERPG
jgi:hypothetical protein